MCASISDAFLLELPLREENMSTDASQEEMVKLVPVTFDDIAASAKPKCNTCRGRGMARLPSVGTSQEVSEKFMPILFTHSTNSIGKVNLEEYVAHSSR